MDYGSNWWGGSVVRPPAEPSALGLSRKYGDPDRASDPQGVDATMMSSRGDPYDTLKFTAQDEDSFGRVARFALSDYSNYRNQMLRALGDDDVETLRRLTGAVDRFVGDNEDDLRYWRQTLSRSRDKEAQAIAGELDGVLTGEYKNRLASGGRTLRMALDDTSPEGIARRAGREALKLGVDDSTARALIDPNDRLYPVFKAYGESLVGRPAPAGSAGEQALKDSRPAVLANFKAAVPFAQDYLDRFGSAQSLGSFLSEYDRVFNADGVVSGQSLLRDAADGFLAQGGTDPTGYLSSLKGLRDLVLKGIARTTDSKEETSARMQDANSIIGAFVQEAVKAGGPVPLNNSMYADMLAASAAKVATLSSVYGIDLREGVSGLSPRVAKMALKALNVPGADDEGLTDFFNAVTPALDLYLGSDGVPAPKVDAKGNMVVTAADGRLAPIENAVRRAAGRRLWSLYLESGASSVSGAGVMGRLAMDQRWQTELKGAIADELAKTLGNATVAERVAEDIHRNILGDTHTTVLQSLVRQTGKVDPDGAPIIPQDLRITATSGAKADGTAAALTGAPTIGTLDKLIAAPAKMIPTVTGDSWRPPFVKEYAIAQKKALRPGVSDSDRYHAAEALGNLVGFGDDGGGDGGIEGAMVRRAVAISAGGVEKALGKSTTVARDLRLIASRVREGDPDAILSAALIVSQAKDYEQHVLVHDSARRPGALAPPLSYVETENSREYKNLRDALVSANLLASLKDKGDNVLASAIVALGARGDLDKTILVKSGYLDPQTGVTSANRMLMKMQQKAFSDPMSKTYTSLAADKPETHSPSEAAARRVLSRLMPKDTLVGMEQSRYLEHLRRQGYSEQDAVATAGAAAGELASAYEHGGAAGLMNLSTKLQQHRLRFFPAPPIQSKIDGKFHLTGAVDKYPTPMTDEEYETEREIRAQQLLDVGITINPFLFENAQVDGLGEYRKQMAVIEAQRKAFATAAAREDARARREEQP